MLDYQDHHVILLTYTYLVYRMFFCLHISVLPVSLRCECLQIFIIITLLTFMELYLIFLAFASCHCIQQG